MTAQSNVNWRQWMQGLGRQARRVREFIGLSQEQLARLAGVSQGAVSRLEAGRGLATPLLVVVKLNAAMKNALSTYDPDVLSREARALLEFDLRLPEQPGGPFKDYPMARDGGIDELIRLYRGLPERQRDKLLAVARVTATALGSGDGVGEERSAPERSASRGVG
jgi:transcriptional regulator with XRE-family HTH domain